MQGNGRDLAQFVPNPLSPGQEQRILQRVLDRNEGRPGLRSRAPLLAAGALLVAAALLLVGIPSWPAGPWTDSDAPPIAAETGGAQWYATGEERMVVVLQGGRRLELQSLTQLHMLDDKASRARLERGTVRCEGGRERLTIEAGNAEVYCDGETLSAEMGLERDGPHLTVSALSGPVTVQYAGKLYSIATGMTWAARDPEKETPKAVVPSVPVDPEKTPDDQRRASTASPKIGAEDLWKDAQDARLAGEAAQAARAFSRLMTEFPSDRRAGLAAFELGRIQLDGLGNPSAALRAFDFAIKQGRGGFFVGDAAAGRVTALDRMGSRSACERAREVFLKEHASSPHLSRVQGLCSK